MEKPESLIGKQFGRLTVIGIHGKDKRGSTLLSCKCSCGSLTTAKAYQLRNGCKKSCGCLQKEIGKINFTKHGGAGSRLYKVWIGIKKRCYSKRCISYKNYGARGIKMCSEWKEDFGSFRKFMLSIGYNENSKFKEQTIERIDVNGDYEPSNCKLVSMKEQNLNKRNNHIITYKGETKTVTEFAEDFHLDVDTVLNRINNYGYTIEEALEKPIRKCPHKNAPKYKIGEEEYTLREWAENLGITRSQLKSKIRHKSLEEVIRIMRKEDYNG